MVIVMTCKAIACPQTWINRIKLLGHTLLLNATRTKYPEGMKINAYSITGKEKISMLNHHQIPVLNASNFMVLTVYLQTKSHC